MQCTHIDGEQVRTPARDTRVCNNVRTGRAYLDIRIGINSTYTYQWMKQRRTRRVTIKTKIVFQRIVTAITPQRDRELPNEGLFAE